MSLIYIYALSDTVDGFQTSYRMICLLNKTALFKFIFYSILCRICGLKRK